MSYGADPTGSADSSPAFFAAFAALTPGGGTLCLPPGTFKIGVPVACPSGVVIQGSGQAATILSMSRPSRPMRGRPPGQLILSGSYISLRDLQVQSADSPTGAAVFLQGNLAPPTPHCLTIRNCFFTNCQAGAIASSGLLIDVTISECYLDSNCLTGPHIATPVVSLGNGSSTLLRIDKCYFSNNNNSATGTALQIYSGDNTSISRSYFESSGNAILVGSETGATISECGFEYMVGASGCIVESYTCNVGVLTVRNCSFSIYSPWTPNLPIISSNCASVIIENNYFVGNPAGFITANGITLSKIVAANLNQIRLANNTCPDDATFGTMIGADADAVYGSIDSYTNLVLHSSFEDASHVTGAGGVTPSWANGPHAGYLGNTAQQLAWVAGASQTATFTNACDSVTQLGDTYIVSFYAKVSAGPDVRPDLPFQIGMQDAALSEAWFACAPTSVWRRFILKSVPAIVAGCHCLVMTMPPAGLPATTILIDGLQIEKNARRPHPLITTANAPLTVTLTNSAAT
jgi:hypothetical protein